MKTFLSLVVTGLISLGAFAQTKSTAQDTSWKIVPNENVCMVTETHFPKPQIPVKVDGKTYYGCCENCKKTLTQEKTARTATDPVSKKPVDKASAVIAANSEGNVMYFESKQNFEKFSKDAQGKKPATK